jgi:signal transduction histidine kinase
MPGGLLAHGQRLQFAVGDLSRRWAGRIGLAAAVGVAYFLAAKLSVGFVIKGVAVFWPAAGISSGVLIVFGPHARWPVLAGVIVATVAAHLTVKDPLWAGVALGLCNGVEALITAGLIQHFFGTGFNIVRLRNVIGLLAAAAAGAIVSGIGGAVTYRLWQGPSAPMLTTWQHWFASDVVGIITVAPLVIGLAAVVQRPSPRSEVIEGTLALAALAAMTGFIIWLSREPWETVFPITWLFPILFWLAARCRPAFSAVGAFVVSITIVWTTILGIGHFGDPSLPIADRVMRAQAGILVVTFSAYFLAALFAERRESATRLAHSYMMLERERENKLMNIDAVTSSIAHEVRQPLTGITAAASAARRWLERVPPDVGMVKQLLDNIERAGFRANEVLANLRKLFQDADHGQRSIDVNNMTLEALQILRGELNDHSVKTDVELASELPLVAGHRVQLQEVILNLVNNAIDAMAPIKVDLRVLKVRTRSDGAKAIIIEVEDSGQGIEPERLGSIFEAFVTTKPHGSGLGLAICNRIIERHGGQLTAASDGKNGALFKIVLPVEPTVTSAARVE